MTDLDLATGVGDTGRWREEAEWLRAQARAGATLCSVCTGSLLLACTGLLDGQEATTHWAAAELMREAFPAVRCARTASSAPRVPGGGSSLAAGRGPGRISRCT